MADASKRGKKQPPSQQIDKDPAVERGERIAAGKAIHRGGKTTGHGPSATEQKSQRKEERHAGADPETAAGD